MVSIQEESIWAGLLELFFPTPRICPFCGTKQAQLGVCAECQAQLVQQKENHKQCQRCGTFGVSAVSCDNCRGWPAYLVHNYSGMPYKGVYREAMLQFKYRRAPWLAKVLVTVVASEIDQEFDVIVPVPLHKRRLWERGYNQSALLARELAKILTVPVAEKVLIRVVNTAHQTKLSRGERAKNLDGAFRVIHPEAIKGCRVLLVDDILTTGTTIAHCAKILHQNGAKIVAGVTIASGIK